MATSHKWERLLAQLKQVVSSTILRDLADPRIGFVTVTEVKLSKDKQHMKVYASVLGNDAQKELTIKALDSSKGFIQSQINKSMRLQFTPKLRFYIDNSLEIASEMSELIRKARESDPDGGKPVEPEKLSDDNSSTDSES